MAPAMSPPYHERGCVCGHDRGLHRPLRHPGRIPGAPRGGAQGALAVRQLLHLLPSDAAVYLVVNPYRPFMRSAEEIVQVAGLIAEAAGRSLTALVANPNLAGAGPGGSRRGGAGGGG